MTYAAAMPHVRRATIHDLPGTYRVCLRTGDSGKDATGLARDPDLLGHVYVGPYIVGQPDLALVVADESGVAGYCLAAGDTRAWEAGARHHWWPDLRAYYPLPTDDDGSLDASLIRQIHERPDAPAEVVGVYPSHVHIDLLERVRGAGFGRRLIETQLAQLRGLGSRGVHLDVADDNGNAIEFYRHLGFGVVVEREGSLVMGLALA
jgi:ribosomal protein S18 acetylase RimI-like enzyme